MSALHSHADLLVQKILCGIEYIHFLASLKLMKKCN